MNKITRTWQDTFQHIIQRALGGNEGARLWQKYHAAFSAEYRALISPRYAIKDILHLEKLTAADRQCVSLVKPYRNAGYYRLHFYSRQERYLDEYIPVLENIQLRVMDQVQFSFSAGGVTAFIKSFTIKAAKSQCAPFYRLGNRMLAAIQVLMDGKVENDALNKLLVLNGMAWHEIDVLRAYRNYFLQLGSQTSRASIHHALINNPEVALCLFNYFEARFRPAPAWADTSVREEQILFPLRLELLEHMASVADINDDRILRTLFNLIDATMRSNYHKRLGEEEYFLAFKINSLGIIEMPLPKPQNEIYVHAAGMEGIHLRAGKISRGGIRWSDRPDDFRTEILGLMQTQISKNALIIPTGAKGGFVVKKNGLNPDFKEAGKKAYVTLIQGLLELTDNYVDDKVAKAGGLVAHDDSDPYLVVAADKGTAKFSDIANSVSADYRFWLGDAFASGGSRGYDHKALGITARGAFECVKRHFRELGKDIQTESFTVVGIGSMDGDVFGNGMLLSPCIRLLAAFSGQHIFIDPNPVDGDAAFKERRRLFELPGSSWNNYDRALISSGGGVYSRSAKDIKISPELKKWLGIRYKTLDGESLIRYLLTAPVDLLWLGGIGTYVKSVYEKHEEVGDRANDNVRINAADLRAGVVGEGANLGFTQKARIEYGLRGGRINTDAVDNSAGVDTSDHEVNLKILLTALHKKNIIGDYQPLFTDMTDEVCRQVLADNYAQSLCLSLELLRCQGNFGVFLQLAEHLELAGYLDRFVESFPNSKEVLARPGQLLTRPELAVLMSACKMYLTRQMENQGGLLNEDYFFCYLQGYFPEQLSLRFHDYLPVHPLANEIKATVISNKIINQAGSCFLSRAIESENPNMLDHVSCYLAFDLIMEGDRLRREINALDNKIPASRQYGLLLELEKTLADFCSWSLLQKTKICPDQQTIHCYRDFIAEYNRFFVGSYLGGPESVSAETAEGQKKKYFRELLKQYQEDGVPDDLAQKMVVVAGLNDFPLLVSLALERSVSLTEVVKLFNEITDILGLDGIYEQMAKISVHDNWERAVALDTNLALRRLAGVAVRNIVQQPGLTCTGYFELPANREKFYRYQRTRQEIMRAAPVSLFPYIALTKALGRLFV